MDSRWQVVCFRADLEHVSKKYAFGCVRPNVGTADGGEIPFRRADDPDAGYVDATRPEFLDQHLQAFGCRGLDRALCILYGYGRARPR
jgi:hypothetical protein